MPEAQTAAIVPKTSMSLTSLPHDFVSSRGSLCAP
jgi:hypothetical protein